MSELTEDKRGTRRKGPEQCFAGNMHDTASDAGGSESDMSALWTSRSCIPCLHATDGPPKSSTAGRLATGSQAVEIRRFTDSQQTVYCLHGERNMHPG